MKTVRNLILISMTFAVAMFISGCGNYGGMTYEEMMQENEELIEEADKHPVVPDAAGEDPIKSDIHTQEEYQEAVWAALDEFEGFEGCTMSSIEYAGDEAAKAEAEYRKCDPKDVIVLTSTFKTGDQEEVGPLEPNTTYSDYKWIIIRDESGKWIHEDHGYA